MLECDLMTTFTTFHQSLVDRQISNGIVRAGTSPCWTLEALQRGQDRWKDHRPSMGTLDAGPHALAKARLLCMAWGPAMAGVIGLV